MRPVPSQTRTPMTPFSGWGVEGTDNNNVWVDAEPGTRYETAHAAEEAAEELAAQKADDLASAAADVRARR